MRLSHLDALIGSDLEFRFRVLDRSNSSVDPIEPNENTFDILALHGDMCEALDAVPTVSSRKNLHVVSMGTLQDHVPEIALYGMVNSILRFVDEQEAVSAICKSQGNSKQTYRPIAKTFQRNRTRLARQPQNYAPTCPSATQAVVSDHCDSIDGTTKNQLQTTHRLAFPVRERNSVPIPHDVGSADAGVRFLKRCPAPARVRPLRRRLSAVVALALQHQGGGNGMRRNPMADSASNTAIRHEPRHKPKAQFEK